MKLLFLFPLVAVVLAPAFTQAETSSPTPTEPKSLKDKTDQELVEIITGQKLPPRETAGFKESMKPSPLDRLWEMPASEAARALVSDNTEPRVELKIDDPSAKPPQKGEIGFRWVGGGHYAPVRHGVTILKYDGYKSQLLISELEISGEASPGEIEQAVRKTDTHPMRRLVAQQTYEILWWLRHIRLSDKTNPAGWEEASTFKDLPTRFWIEPGGTIITGVITNREEGPCGACLAKGNKGAYADFAEMLLQRLIERSGIQQRYPMPTIGRHVDQDDDAKFLHTPPPGNDPAKLKQWIGKMTDILRNQKRHYLHSQVMDALVSISNPLRYDDDRIDAALLDVLHQGLEVGPALKRLEELDNSEFSSTMDVEDSEQGRKAAKIKEQKLEQRRAQKRELRGWQSTAFEAAEKLGYHDAANAFPELFQLATGPEPDSIPGYNRPLIAAASIAARHPEFRAEVAKYLEEQLAKPTEAAARGTLIIEAIWRADLRELTSQLERIAALPRPAPDPGDVREATIEKASLLLMAWRESDPLTRAKLNAMLTGRIGGGATIPEVLRREFAELSPEDQFTFRQFINWMRIAGASVQLRYLENTFTPHTPRPDILYER